MILYRLVSSFNKNFSDSELRTELLLKTAASALAFTKTPSNESFINSAVFSAKQRKTPATEQ